MANHQSRHRFSRTALFAVALSGTASPALAEDSNKADFTDYARQYCELDTYKNQMPVAMMEWAKHTMSQQEVAGLQGKNYSVIKSSLRSYVPWEEVICTATIRWTQSTGKKPHTLEVRDMDYRIFGSEDGSEVWVSTSDWPDKAAMKTSDNAFNWALVVDGETLSQAWDRKRAADAQMISEMFADQDAKEQEETRRRAPACEAAGGTWGYKMVRNNVGMWVQRGELGCYFQTVGE